MECQEEIDKKRREAKRIFCEVYSEYSEQYQDEVKCEGAAEDYFEQKRVIVNQRVMSDPRVIEANKLWNNKF
jgi:hypothetical protein